MSRRLYEPTSEDYGHSELYGPRNEISKSVEDHKTSNDADCVIYQFNTYAEKQTWKINNLKGLDQRLKNMFNNLEITYATPIQRFGWPNMNKGRFPILCVAPRATGKTYAHLLYVVSQSIKSTPKSMTDEMMHQQTVVSTTDNQAFIARNYPKFLIVTSTYDRAERLVITIDGIKSAVFGQKINDPNSPYWMPPIAKSVSVDHQEDKLAKNCNRAEIIVGPPAAILKCLDLDTVNFTSTEKVIFDDIDLCLQVNNSHMRQLMSAHLSQTETSTSSQKIASKPGHIVMFASKWTELVKKFLSVTFPQRIIIFASLSEASVYLNLRFEIELYGQDKARLEKITKLVSLFAVSTSQSLKNQQRLAIVCNDDDESRQLHEYLKDSVDYPLRLVDEQYFSDFHMHQSGGSREPVIIISDTAIDIEVECTRPNQQSNDITHLVHYSTPSNMHLFDKRFRLMHKNIRNEIANLQSTIFISQACRGHLIRQVYDLVSRSATTQRSSKSTLRDLLNKEASPICWRWATSGICRFEKTNRDDLFGSFCPNAHVLLSKALRQANRWPDSGQVKITLTHIVSPNEFFFWFEAHRDINSRHWTKIQATGHEFMKNLQVRLDKLRNVGVKTVPVDRIRSGCVYGVYFHDVARIDRVRLMSEPKHSIKVNKSANVISTSLAKVNEELEYSQQVLVEKIDYGVKVDVFVRNIIELPDDLRSIEPQCHRGFYLGVRPTSNEPNWNHQANRRFYEEVTAHNVRYTTVWLRMSSNNCFWFDNMLITRQLVNIDSNDMLTVKPHMELCTSGHAEITKTEPSFLPPSVMLITLGKWNSQELEEAAQFAFLRSDKPVHDVYVLNAFGSFELRLLLSEFIKTLMSLENDLLEDFLNDNLNKQQHLAEGAYCLVRFKAYQDPNTNEVQYTINRARIRSIQSFEPVGDLDRVDTGNFDDKLKAGTKYCVDCLDHGDCREVSRDDLFEAKPQHLRQLPFQSISCRLANINKTLLEDIKLRSEVLSSIFDVSRDPDNNYKIMKCKISSTNEVYLFGLKDDDSNIYHPMSRLLETRGINLHETQIQEYDQVIHDEKEELTPTSEISNMYVKMVIRSAVCAMIRRELIDAGANLNGAGLATHN